MTEQNIATAQSEYYKRPADERFDSLTALLLNAQADRANSHEAHYNLRDLRATPADDGRALLLASPKGAARFNHYSFGQLCSTIGAPAKYLRTLPADLAARNVNHGLQDAAPIGTVANLLIKDDDVDTLPTIRACTSETYGRVWDAQLYGEVDRHFGDGKESNGGQWITPPAWPGSLPSGNYRGDRDSFIIRVNGGSIVTDPSVSSSQGPDGGALYRGLMLRNSEVGHCSVTIECILFRYICGNHMLWGAIMDRQFRRRHVGTKITRDTMRELADLAYKFNHRSEESDRAIIAGLISHEIAHTPEGVIDELRKMGATKEEASAAVTACEEHEAASPRSFWGVTQGLTRISQDSGHQDDRLRLDLIGSRLLVKGRELVAA